MNPKVMVCCCVIARLMSDDAYVIAANSPTIYHPDVEIQLCERGPCESTVNAAKGYNFMNGHPTDCIKYLPHIPNPDNGNPNPEA